MSQEINIRRIPNNATALIQHAADLVWQHSWGPDYPIHPIEEMREAEYHVGAFIGDELIGYSAVSRLGSPDGKDTGELWYGYLVVLPEYRGQGVRQRLYDSCMVYAAQQDGRILACTDNHHMDRFFVACKWLAIRMTTDRGGDLCTVYEYRSRRP